MKKMFALLIVLVVVVKIYSCRDGDVDTSKLTGSDYRLFRYTPAWELAKAFWDKDEEKVDEILKKDSTLINYQEPKYGETLLQVSVGAKEKDVFRLILKKGAKVDVPNKFSGETALFWACSDIDDAEYVKLLLEYGADPNFKTKGGYERFSGLVGRAPLYVASRYGNLESVKLLISHGADVNYDLGGGNVALFEPTYLLNYDILLYLLESGADYTRKRYDSLNKKEEDILDYLRWGMPEEGTKYWDDKQKVITFLLERGVDYRSSPIPERIVGDAKSRYPNSWQEYLKKY